MSESDKIRLPNEPHHCICGSPLANQPPACAVPERLADVVIEFDRSARGRGREVSSG